MPDETKVTTIKTVSARVTLEIDLGFLPFMKVVRHYNGKNIPFGLRDASRAKFDVFMSAEVGDDMTPDEAGTMLVRKAHDLCDRELRAAYPESFEEARKVEVPEEAFVIQSTIVNTAPVGDF